MIKTTSFTKLLILLNVFLVQTEQGINVNDKALQGIQDTDIIVRVNYYFGWIVMP